MGKLYMIADSPGKGRGVFATKAIHPGTIIIEEKPGLQMHLNSNAASSHDVFTPAAVQKAFDRLPPAFQTRFLSLHEGSRPYPSKIFRIYKANVFLNSEGAAAVYFDISHINHSCVRNAELEVGDSVTTVIANRLIAKGEEVTICYHSMYDSMTKRARGNIMRVYYDFECSCPACTLPRREQMLSDVRRSLLNVLTNAVVGKQPMDLGFYDALRSLGRVQAEQKRGVPVWPLEKPLTLQQETAYNVLIAGLLTAEGLSGIAVPRAYLAAAKGLYLQIVEDENWMLVQSAAFLRMWSAQARDGTKAIRTAASEDYVNVQNFEEGISRDRKVKIAWDIINRGFGHGYSAAFEADPSSISGPLRIKCVSEKTYAARLRGRK